MLLPFVHNFGYHDDESIVYYQITKNKPRQSQTGFEMALPTQVFSSLLQHTDELASPVPTILGKDLIDNHPVTSGFRFLSQALDLSKPWKKTFSTQYVKSFSEYGLI